MNRPTGFHFFGLLLLLSLETGGLCASARGAADAASPAKSGARPNILVIMTDDQRWDTLGCAGNPVIQTPNFDQMAAEGVRFRNMFVTASICAASRATLLTGLYERTHRYNFGTNPVIEEHARFTFPRLLREAGYRTGHVGKFNVELANHGEAQMYDVFRELNRKPYMKKQPDGSLKHLTDIEADTAIDFIKTARPGQPWALNLCFNAPHAEDGDKRQYIWSPASDGLYEDVTFTPPATMDEAFFQAQPDFLKNTYSRVRWTWRFDEPQKYQQMVRGYYRMITDVDRAVGRVRAAIAKAGMADNTVILYTGDNGYFLGDRGFAEKWYLYEESVRVPLIVVDPRAPKARKGVTNDDTVLNVDLAPTILDLAGLPAPSHYHGKSLREVIAGNTPADWRKDFFYYHLMDANGPGSANPWAYIPKSEGVRNERFTYIRWFEQKPVVEELYDHLDDFHCTKNLINDPKYADVLAALRKRNDALRATVGGDYVPNAAPPKPDPATKPATKPAKVKPKVVAK